jgi:leader peptidase (prepilin peptidase)/N-methyltransferase
MLSILFAVIGIVTGILINRAADNLPPPPRRSFLATPRCPYCDAPRTRLEQFGILSFALRRDKCHQCSAPLRLRAPLVEIASALVFAFLAARFAFDAYLVAVCFFTALLLLIVVIDIEHKLILNVLSIPFTALALLVSPLVLGGAGTNLGTLNLNLFVLALLGAVIGYAITYAIYLLGVLFLRLVNRGRTNKITTVAFGMGDVKLAGLLGALVGFPQIIYVLVYAILLGGVGALIAIFVQLLRKRGLAFGMAMPYGPYLALAAWVFMIFRPPM